MLLLAAAAGPACGPWVLVVEGGSVASFAVGFLPAVWESGLGAVFVPLGAELVLAEWLPAPALAADARGGGLLGVCALGAPLGCGGVLLSFAPPVVPGVVGSTLPGVLPGVEAGVVALWVDRGSSVKVGLGQWM